MTIRRMAPEPLIGRHAELERIDAVLAAREDLPAGVLLHGGSGIGKTVLWREAVRRAAGAGYRVVDCSLSRSESRLTFAGLGDLIGPVLPEVLPELAAIQAQALESALAISDDLDPPKDERAVAFGLRGALSVLAQRSPIALAIDDVQWLDPSSGLMLSYAIRRLRTEPIVLIFARRDGDDGADWLGVSGGPGVDLERITLEPLPLGAIHRIIRTRLGFSLTRPRLLRVYAASGGNPLHALELARATEADDDDPGSLLALLGNRVAALPAATRTALGVVAMSSVSSIEALAAPYGPRLLEDIAPAIEAELVAVRAGRIRFTHPLIARAAEAAIPEAQRDQLNRLLAGAASSDAVRATHLAAATRTPSFEVSEILDSAGRETRRRGARATSAALFEDAARLTPPPAAETRARRLLEAALAWFEAGDVRRAEAILESLRRDLARGELRCEASWRLGVLRDEAGRWEEAVALWREALADTDERGLRSQILCSLAITAFYTESVKEAKLLAVSAVGAAERSSDPRHLARALAIQALTIAMSGGRDIQPIIDRGLALEAGIGESLGEWSPSVVAAECARHACDVEAARRQYTAIFERAVNAGDANGEQWAAFGLGSTEILAGHYARASELADVVSDLADQTGQGQISARVLRAHVDAYLGDLVDARRLIGEAIDVAAAANEGAHLFSALIVRAMIEVTAGDLADAARTYRDARRIAHDLGLAHATALRGFANEAEAAAAAGELDQAEAALAALDAAVAGDPPPWIASIRHRATGTILAARGDLLRAQLELEEATHGDDQVPLDRGRALLALGSVSRRLREHTRARAALRAALEIFEELGSPPWIKRAGEEIDRIPGRRISTAPGLTYAESRIAELVAAGGSNREVAVALFLTVKTVEVTLTRIYQKMGVRSRAGLAHAFGAAAKH
jgi:DNA-binding CsgD family transcriptional regulator